MSASAATAERGAAPRRSTLARTVRRHAWTVGVIVLLAVMIYVQTRMNSNWSSFDVQTLASAAVPLAFAAMAQSVIIIGGGVDLSIGAQIGLMNAIAARSMDGRSFRDALLISLGVIAMGIAIGVLTGAVIGVSGVPDIVVTLASSFVWLGLALEVLSVPGGSAPDRYAQLASDTFHSEWVPTILVILVVTFALVWLPIRRSRLGLSIYAIGSDRNAAFLSGVNLFRARILAYAIGGIFTAMAALALTAITLQGDPNAGQTANYTLNSVAAAVLGGVSLAGGVGGLLGPMVGAFVLSLVPTLLTLREVDANWSLVIQGAVVILVVMVAGIALQRRKA